MATSTALVPAPRPAVSSESVIETEGLTKQYSGRVVVDDLSFRVPKGCIAAFVGPNGAGKSTTLRMLLGLVYPTSGTARVLDGSIENPATFLARVGALIEGPAFYPALSGRTNLEVLRVLGGHRRERIDQALELVGLLKRSADKVSKYSLGMKQRLGVAAALLPEPKLLILDEPANGLDPDGIASMRAFLRKVADDGVTILVSSHQLSELQQIADWVLIINQGRLKYEGELNPLLRTGTRLTIRPDDDKDVDRLASALTEKGYEFERSSTSSLVVELPASRASEISKVAADLGIYLKELHNQQASLEDIYFTLTRD